jgi:hypothetical protein
MQPAWQGSGSRFWKRRRSGSGRVRTLLCTMSLLGLLLISGRTSSQEPPPEPILTPQETALARRYILTLESELAAMHEIMAYSDSVQAVQLEACRKEKGISSWQVLGIVGTAAGVALLIAWTAFKLGVTAN